MEDVRWLKAMLSSELEVRPPASDKKEAKYLTGNCVKIYRDGNLVAYAEMRKVGSHTEISTVLVDSKYRNQGIGKELIEKAIREIEITKSFAVQKTQQWLLFYRK